MRQGRLMKSAGFWAAGFDNRPGCPVEGTGRNGSNRVNRGGSWNNNARNLRSANRNRNEPSNRNNNLGFRCAGSSGLGAFDQMPPVHGPADCAERLPDCPCPESAVAGLRG
ncbi:MAG: SUMF1/EgtB/PvdO family nonheme iron enzyme [bacterium]